MPVSQSSAGFHTDRIDLIVPCLDIDYNLLADIFLSFTSTRKSFL